MTNIKRLKRQRPALPEPERAEPPVRPLNPDWQSWQLLDQIERQVAQQLDELRAIRRRLPPRKGYGARTQRRQFRVLVEAAVSSETDDAPASDWQTLLDYRVGTSGWRAALALASDFGYNADDEPPGRVEYGGR